MLIGIIEVSEPNHYSAVNGLVKTYTSDKNNEVIVYTLPAIKIALEENGLPDNASVTLFDKNDSLKDLLQDIEHISFDRIHICTIFDNYIDFAKFAPQAKEILLHIHHCEEWFNDSLQRSLITLFSSLKNKDQNRAYWKITARTIVDYLVYRPLRQKILSRFDKYYKLQLVVHSQGQKEALIKYSCKFPIRVFPFAIYEGMEDRSQDNQVLRICIPGVITQAKRDYLGLFKALQQNAETLRDKIDLYLLGYINDREKQDIEPVINNLVNAGYKIYYHKSFVYGDEFDNVMAHSDILLNNQFITRNNTEIYGQTKESGMIFNMLRAAKPGIIPKEYQVSSEFNDCTLFFESYPHLIELIAQVVNEPQLLDKLKASAKELAVTYSSESLYPRLV
jgi:hypothetical protein